jgi:hypothetical protein
MTEDKINKIVDLARQKEGLKQIQDAINDKQYHAWSLNALDWHNDQRGFLYHVFCKMSLKIL